MNDGYADMLALPHYTSKKHPRMSRLARAAQFSPFAALTGYDAVLDESARRTCAKRTLTDEEQTELNAALASLEASFPAHEKIEAVFFLPDPRKDGGSEETHVGRFSGVDAGTRQLVFRDGTRILLDDLYAVRILQDDKLCEKH